MKEAGFGVKVRKEHERRGHLLGVSLHCYIYLSIPWGIASLINRNAFHYVKMFDVNDKSACTRTSSCGAEPTSGAATTRKRKDPPSPRKTTRTHKRTNIAATGPPAAHAGPDSYAIATLSSRTKCFRVSGIPQDWEEDDLLGALQTIDPDLRRQEGLQLSLYPACCGSSQTALLELDTTEYFQSLGPNESTYKRAFPAGRTEAVLTIDSHLYDLTPLNTPDEQIIAELVATCLPKRNSDANTRLIAV